jgi:8-oxo-dGTP pyrophosphatase MutT (NUDIX family)
MSGKIEVAIGILTDAENRLLVGRRMSDPQRGKWEMPGGKVESGVEEALRREFKEEGGIQLTSIARWTKIESTSHILHLFRVFSKEIFVPAIYLEYAYVEADESINLDWIASNKGFVHDLRDILKAQPAIDAITFSPQNMDELADVFDKISFAYTLRDRFFTIACILDVQTFYLHADMETKVDLMYHEGVKFYASGKPPIALPSYIEFLERGKL